MDPDQWVMACAARLREQWPHIADEDLRDAARELWADAWWGRMEPCAAAAAWLRLGALAGSDAAD